MTVEMRFVLGRIPVTPFRALPVGESFGADNKSLMRHVKVISPDQLEVSATERGTYKYRGDAPYGSDINSLNFGTVVPGLKRQLHWKKDK